MVGQAQLVQQKTLHRAREGPLAFQAHGGQAAALLQDALHVLPVVLALLLGAFRGVQVGVAGDADDVGVLHRVHGEDLGHEHLDGVLHEHVGQAVTGQLDDPGRLARQGDDAERDAFGPQVLRLLALGLFGTFGLLGLGAGLLLLGLLLLRGGLLIQTYDNVQTAVFQMGEGMARIHDLRREEGQHVVLHVVVEEHQLLVGEVVLAQLVDALGRQKPAQVLVGFLVVGVQLVAPLIDGVQLLGRRHAGFRVDDGLLQQREVGERPHAHHEELLQVAPEDGDEVQALEQGHRGVGALVEHALVEVKPRQLAVLHIRGLGKRGFGVRVLRCLLVHDPAPPLSLAEKLKPLARKRATFIFYHWFSVNRENT